MQWKRPGIAGPFPQDSTTCASAIDDSIAPAGRLPSKPAATAARSVGRCGRDVALRRRSGCSWLACPSDLARFRTKRAGPFQGLEAIHLDSRKVRKQFFVTVVRGDKPEALGIIEPFDRTACHKLPQRKNRFQTGGRSGQRQMQRGVAPNTAAPLSRRRCRLRRPPCSRSTRGPVCCFGSRDRT